MSYILIFVLAIIALIGIRYLLNRNRILGLLTLSISTLGIYLVIFPEFSTKLANLLGVGRGADLLLYSLFLISILGLFLSFIKINQNSQLITMLVRANAIANARKQSNDHK